MTATSVNNGKRCWARRGHRMWFERHSSIDFNVFDDSPRPKMDYDTESQESVSVSMKVWCINISQGWSGTRLIAICTEPYMRTRKRTEIMRKNDRNVSFCAFSIMKMPSGFVYYAFRYKIGLCAFLQRLIIIIHKHLHVNYDGSTCDFLW